MKADTLIILKDLPVSLLNKIPFSLRIHSQTYTFSELPREIQYLIEKYYESQVPEIEYSGVYDYEFGISEYSDLKSITSPKQLALYYFRNYMMVLLGSYPYDAELGSALKRQLQTKDTSLQQTRISAEIQNIAQAITNDLGIDVIAPTFTITPVRNTDSTDYVVNISLTVSGEPAEITVQSQGG